MFDGTMNYLEKESRKRESILNKSNNLKRRASAVMINLLTTHTTNRLPNELTPLPSGRAKSIECLNFPQEFWNMDPDLIAWYFYWTDPGVLAAAESAGVTTMDEFLIWLAENYCAYYGG